MVDQQQPEFYTDHQGILTSADPPFQVFFPTSFAPSVLYRDPAHPEWIKLWAAKGTLGIGMNGQLRPSTPFPIAIETRNLERDIAKAPLPAGMDVTTYAQLIQARLRTALLWCGFQGVEFIGKGSSKPGLAYLSSSAYRWRLVFTAAAIVIFFPIAIFVPALKGVAIALILCLASATAIAMKVRQRRQWQQRQQSTTEFSS